MHAIPSPKAIPVYRPDGSHTVVDTMLRPRGCATAEKLGALLAEISAPGSRANRNERDAAAMLLGDGLGAHLGSMAELEEVLNYYRREHLGELSSHLYAKGA